MKTPRPLHEANRLRAGAIDLEAAHHLALAGRGNGVDGVRRCSDARVVHDGINGVNPQRGLSKGWGKTDGLRSGAAYPPLFSGKVHSALWTGFVPLHTR